jgi:hypothetical protein
MKPDPPLVTAQDRLATWDEIRRVTSTTLDRILEHCYTQGAFCEIESELGGRIRYPADEIEFFVYLSESKDVNAN